MSVAVINYDSRMTRWEPDSRGRLQKAALELYGERGFENTTVAEIAGRAGLTERTFFRHFADKREVLFAGGNQLEELVVKAIDDAPGSLAAVDAVAAGLEAGAGLLQERGEFAGQRQRIVAANADLQERERAKLASIAAAIAAALRRRGIEEPTAALVAEVGIAVFRIGFQRWTEDGCRGDLAQLMRDSLAQLRAVTAPG
jgi:AcrR family transcriptional regulator